MDYKKGEKLFSVSSYVCIALVLAAGFLLMLAFCKCPHCGAHMRLRERKTGYCPECGEKLT